jgi:hypothetical protein
MVALEQAYPAPHTEPTLNIERCSRRLIMTKWLGVLAGLAVLAGSEVRGQSTPDSIQGTWQTVEVTLTGPGARTITIREPRPNLMIVTAKYYSRVEDQSDRPRAPLADASKANADELRAVWGPFVAEAGTYEVTSGHLLTMRPIAAKNPAVMAPGAFITYSYRLEGNTIWVTQQRNQQGPFANPVTIKAVRVEGGQR